MKSTRKWVGSAAPLQIYFSRSTTNLAIPLGRAYVQEFARQFAAEASGKTTSEAHVAHPSLACKGKGGRRPWRSFSQYDSEGICSETRRKTDAHQIMLKPNVQQWWAEFCMHCSNHGFTILGLIPRCSKTAFPWASLGLYAWIRIPGVAITLPLPKTRHRPRCKVDGVSRWYEWCDYVPPIPFTRGRHRAVRGGERVKVYVMRRPW